MGMITTSRIRMQQNQPPVVRALESGARIVFAIPDHAWPLGVDSAKVRVAMTVLTAADDNTPAVLALAPDHDQVATTRGRPVEEGELSRFVREAIDSDLSPSVSLAGIEPLQSNSGLDSAGMKPYARSLIIDREQARALFPNARTRHKHAPEYRNGKDVGQRPRGVHVIDLFGLTKDDVATRYPVAYQYLATHTRPERATERNQRLRDEWWLFEANRPELRRALRGIGRYIVTVENSPVRAFVFLAEEILPDQKLRVVASNDALVLAVLSSRVHSVFAERVGGRHGVANTPVYNSRCFAAFPFPIFTPKQEARVRDLGERLDAHRSHQLTSFPKLTLTSMYNVLAKVRSGDALSEKEKDVYSDGLVAVLAKIHDELDSEVISAYGWPKNVRDEEILGRLVALNRERRTEERTGLIRWLRREFQETGGEQSALGVEEKRSAEVDREDLTPWPRTLPDQVAAIRDLMLRGTLSWSAKQVAARFRGAGVKSVAPVLDSLAALGLVVAFERSGERTWRAARVR